MEDPRAPSTFEASSIDHTSDGAFAGHPDYAAPPSDSWIVVKPKPTQISNDTLGYNVPRYDIASLDGCAAEYLDLSRSVTDPVRIDLSEVSYLEHECLAHLGGIFAGARSAGRPISLQLPSRTGREVPKLIDFLRSWQFPEFAQDITKLPFLLHLTGDDANNWRSLPPVSQFTPVTRTPDGESELLPRSFFALTPIRSLRRPSLAAQSEQSRFLKVSFKVVLKRLLGDGPDEDLRARQIATQIINEAVKNAAMHPNANLAYTTTQIRLPRVEDGDQSTGSLEISVWDDGDSISTTLSRAVDAGIPITTSRFGQETEVFKVSINPHPSRRQQNSFDVSSRIDPSRYYRDELALTVAAFLSGVTSKPWLRDSIDIPERGGSEQHETAMQLTEGGIGLRALRRAAIDLLGGRIQYASGHTRLTMTRYIASDGSSPRNTYRVTIRKLPRSSWSTVGNHLHVSVPFIDRSRAT